MKYKIIEYNDPLLKEKRLQQKAEIIVVVFKEYCLSSLAWIRDQQAWLSADIKKKKQIQRYFYYVLRKIVLGNPIEHSNENYDYFILPCIKDLLYRIQTFIRYLLVDEIWGCKIVQRYIINRGEKS